MGKLLETGKNLFSSLAPSLTLDEQGKLAVNFGISRHTRFVPPLDEVLETPAKIAAQHHRDVVIVMREAVRI